MGLAINKDKIRTLPFILQAVALFLVVLGSIIGGATLRKQDPNSADDRWTAAMACFAAALNLAMTLFDAQQFATVALGAFYYVVGNVFTTTHILRLLKSKGATAGYSFICIGLILSFVSLFPLSRAAEALGKAFAGLRNQIGSAIIAVNLLSCILLWAHSDEAKSTQTLFWAMICLVDVFVFGASYYGGNTLAYSVTLFWFTYVQASIMSVGLVDEIDTIGASADEGGAVSSKPKKDLYLAAFVFAWLGHLAMLAVNIVFPAQAVKDSLEQQRREAFPQGHRESFGPKEDPVEPQGQVVAQQNHHEESAAPQMVEPEV